MKATKEGMSRLTSNTEKAGATREESLSKASDSDRRLSSGDSVDLANRCPTCLVEMDWIHSHYQCPRCGWRDSCCM